MRANADVLKLPAESPALRFVRDVDLAGGRAFVVGGWVRDRLLERPSQDLDIEIHGRTPAQLESLLVEFGPIRKVGAFGVYLLGSDAIQVSLAPLTEVTCDSFAEAFAAAALRRDLTINSLAWDPIDGALLDPLGGRGDLAARCLRASCDERFGDDPLRVFRVARLASTLEFAIDPELASLCRGIELTAVAPERILDEVCRWLLESPRPSIGFEALRLLGATERLTPFGPLVGAEQDPTWHPEGDVWIHTGMVLDAAAELRGGDPGRDLDLMLAALCHDLGKPETTTVEAGRIRSKGHAERGATLTRAWLAELRAPQSVIERVAMLVLHHLTPLQFVLQEAGGRAYRRLERQLADCGLDPRLLERVARADQLGRSTEAARERRFPEGDAFLEAAAEHALSPGPANRDVVLGRHVLERGVAAGPEVGALLQQCRALQDETGLTDPEQILERVLGGWEAERDG